ncbi:MAG: cupin domain-containing protein [Alphaproteobacteria bacterium]|nr:cupin domain-containing protein [Alphaproteobacteria bacterium]MCB9792086.1 cupin domain-containing protein [Alphaproteobacteria bacterium]
MSDKTRRHPAVLNLDEAERREMTFGSRFGATSASLSGPTTSRQLGCRWFELPPGRVTMPYHWHGGAEEALFILSGEGTLRVGEDRVTVRAGDWVSFPAGPEHAHQLENTSDAPLSYLCVATEPSTDVIGYPDSKKIMAWTASEGGEAWHKSIHLDANSVGYFEGEDLG